jgi:hypothetical protein
MSVARQFIPGIALPSVGHNLFPGFNDDHVLSQAELAIENDEGNSHEFRHWI